MPTDPTGTAVFLAGVTERSDTHGSGCAEMRPADRGCAVIETRLVVLATAAVMRDDARALLAAGATERLTAQETP
jgi:hypothetical protein